MLDYGLDVKKGEWTCVAAESPEDIPSDKNQDHNITWLFIRKCQPANASNFPPPWTVEALDGGFKVVDRGSQQGRVESHLSVMTQAPARSVLEGS